MFYKFSFEQLALYYSSFRKTRFRPLQRFEIDVCTQPDSNSKTFNYTKVIALVEELDLKSFYDMIIVLLLCISVSTLFTRRAAERFQSHWGKTFRLA